jgi:tetratricopeptide (TPR) repeat protein
MVNILCTICHVINTIAIYVLLSAISIQTILVVRGWRGTKVCLRLLGRALKMGEETSFSLGALKLVLDFITTNRWPIVFLFLIVFGRKAIPAFFERIIKMGFSWGDASGTVEAASPTPLPPTDQRTEALPATPSTPPLPELVEKKEEHVSEEWFFPMHAAFMSGEVQEAKKIFEAHKANEKDPNARHSDEAVFLYFLYTQGNDPAALGHLRELHARSDNEKQRMDSAMWLSLIYDTIKDYEALEKLWNHELTRVTEQSNITQVIVHLAAADRKQGRMAEAIDCLERRLQEVTDPSQKVAVYDALSSAFKERGDNEAAAIALEKVVQLSPGNREKLFDAAYLQSDVKLDLLSISNYGTLLGLDPKHAVALNNMGVAASLFKMKGKQISLYKRAMNRENTLAMANLANQYIDTGFWDDAKEILDKARVKDNPHENVGRALFRMQSMQTEEDEKWTALQRQAEEFQRRVRAYADARFDNSSTNENFGGLWRTPEGREVGIEQSQQRVVGSWATAVAKINISGTQRNRSVDLTYRRKSEQPTLIGDTDQTIKCYSYLSLDKQQWIIFSIDTQQELTLILSRTA